jgi:hypothetical protein
LVAKTLEVVRRFVPEGMVPIPRDPDDDKSVVETWI